MPRYPRNSLSTSFFHVMTQGINKSYIFDNTDDIKYYINKMKHLTTELNIQILSYCIMNNHAHILLEAKQLDTLSTYMQKLNTAYGKYYNNKYDRVGFVFRNRYRAEGIYNKNQLYNCIQYIANNPVKAGLCKVPEEYPYSFYPKFNPIASWHYSFIDTDECKDQLCSKIIEEFLSDNNIELINLKTNKVALKKIVSILKDEYNFSFRKISDEVKISKNIIYRIYHNS